MLYSTNDMDMDMDSANSVKRKQGFTLLELSIVLVIIGLIIGGVTAGQDLIRSAELQNIPKEIQQYKTIINTYRLKYNALPGDHANAIDYWGAIHANPSTCTGQRSTGTETCNGNGDGLIGGLGTFPFGDEKYRFWQHLANAELITGNYTGVYGTSPGINGNHVPGENCPYSAAIEGAGYQILQHATWSSYAGSSNYPSGSYENPFRLGYRTGSGSMSGAILNSEEAYSIDVKIDNGNPRTGLVIAPFSLGGGLPSCSGGSYNLSAGTTKNCNLMFTKMW
jgi:prepilin-type N-terminal cleavage/methylation domain-containing protein